MRNFYRLQLRITKIVLITIAAPYAYIDGIQSQKDSRATAPQGQFESDSCKSQRAAGPITPAANPRPRPKPINRRENPNTWGCDYSYMPTMTKLVADSGLSGLTAVPARRKLSTPATQSIAPTTVISRGNDRRQGQSDKTTQHSPRRVLFIFRAKAL